MAGAPAGVAAPSVLGMGANPGTANKNAAPPANLLASARLFERRRQDDEAERLYLQVIRQSPGNPVPHHRLAVLYTRKGKFKEADEHFGRALALKPDDPQLLGDVGYFYHLACRPKEAEQYLRRALEIDPGNRAFSNNLALVLADQGRRDECLALFRRAGSEKEARANYAFVLAQQGEYQQALDLYDRVLTEDQSLRPVADAMIELSQLVTSKKPERSTSPSVDEPRTIADNGRNADREIPEAELATGVPCAYTAPVTAAASSPPPTPPADRIAKGAQGISTTSSPSPPVVASPRELPASTEASHGTAPRLVTAATDDCEAALPKEARRPAKSLPAQRLALFAIAGAIFLGIAAAARLRRRSPSANGRSCQPVGASGVSRARPKVALAPAQGLRPVPIQVRRPRRRRWDAR